MHSFWWWWRFYTEAVFIKHEFYHCIPLIRSRWWGGLWDCKHPAVCCLVQIQCQMWRSWEAPGESPVCLLLWSHGSRPQWRTVCGPSSFLSGWGDDISPPPWHYHWLPACQVSLTYCSKKKKGGDMPQTGCELIQWLKGQLAVTSNSRCAATRCSYDGKDAIRRLLTLVTV